MLTDNPVQRHAVLSAAHSVSPPPRGHVGATLPMPGGPEPAKPRRLLPPLSQEHHRAREALPNSNSFQHLPEEPSVCTRLP